MSPLGFWSREWFESVLESQKEGLFEYGSVFFPWWARETDANFYINTAKTLMWIECPWHEPTSEDEIKLYRIICELLEKAYQLDQEMDYPWDEWVELLTLLGETKSKTDGLGIDTIKYLRDTPSLNLEIVPSITKLL